MLSEQSQPSRPTAPAAIQLYLGEIAERLFSGHAALMVGAGFSKNARPTDPSAPKFPDWPDLGDKLYEKIHGRTRSPSRNHSTVPELAGQVEATFGRDVLEETLQNIIPDSLYSPSRLHTRLLRLPWTDVFTTNYDTLLERASSSLNSQQYDLVLTEKDLANSNKPRIIKLHGSFSSNGDFVITEEDYRRYPNDFAPFVNTLRQSLLENILCLVGFSGDDPNFLQSSGWIRDNLGPGEGPKIYLIGILASSPSRRKLLALRDIVAVDLAAFPDVGGKHEIALERFLTYLEVYAQANYAQANSVHQWPQPSVSGMPEEKGRLSTLDTWRKDRLDYPGWIIAPYDRRLQLWTALERSLGLFHEGQNLSSFMDLEFAFELLWRLEKCLRPILPDQISFFEKIAKKYLSFLDLDSVPKSMSERLEKMNRQNLTKQSIHDMCIYIAISILRYFREENCEEKWIEFSGIIENNFENLSEDNQARFYYESVLKSLFDLDIAKLNQQLSNWTIADSLPFWQAKKAGLLAEVGYLEEASVILKNSLATVRRMLSRAPVESNYTLVSQESYIMIHIKAVELATRWTIGNGSTCPETQSQDANRWNILKQYECDPWNELRVFGSILNRPYEEELAVTERKEFDIGSTTRTVHFGDQRNELRMSYSFLRFCEDVGIAFRLPGCDIVSQTAKGALPYIAESNTNWATVTLIRIADNRVVDSVFNRRFLSKLTVSSVDALIAHLIHALENSKEIAVDGRYGPVSDALGETIAAIVPEIVSRLCCKCTLESMNLLGEFLVEAYSTIRERKLRGIRNLVKRLIMAWPREKYDDLMRLLMRLPIPSDLQPVEEKELVNPFLYLVGNRSIVCQEDLRYEVDLVDISEDYWSCSISDDPKRREWAITALIYLHRQRRLCREDIARFSKSLWLQNHLDMDGLPKHTGYFRFILLELPHPDQIQPTYLLLQYLKNRVFVSHEGRCELDDLRTGCAEIAGAGRSFEWPSDECRSIIYFLAKVWDEIKAVSLRYTLFGNPLGSSMMGQNRDTVDLFFEVFVGVIACFPSAQIGLDLRDLVGKITNEIDESELPGLRLKASTLHLFPDRKTSLFSQIKRSIESEDSAQIRDGIQAVMELLRNRKSRVGREIIDLSEVISLPFEMVYWSPIRRSGLPTAIGCVVSLLREDSGVLCCKRLEEMMLRALDRIAEETDLSKDDADASDKLEVRREAVSLAFQLFLGYRSREVQCPAVLSKWKAICQRESEFSEIRNMWVCLQENR